MIPYLSLGMQSQQAQLDVDPPLRSTLAWTHDADDHYTCTASSMDQKADSNAACSGRVSWFALAKQAM